MALLGESSCGVRTFFAIRQAIGRIVLQVEVAALTTDGSSVLAMSRVETFLTKSRGTRLSEDGGVMRTLIFVAIAILLTTLARAVGAVPIDRVA